MTGLIDLILRSEERVLSAFLSHAEANGYFRFAPHAAERWRPTVRGFSGSLVQSLRHTPSPAGLTAGDVGRDDGLSAFGVVEARKRRLEGMPLGIFLGILKFLRQSYLETVRAAGVPPEEEERFRLCVERFFDRNEVASSVAWTIESCLEHVEELIRKHDELSRLYQRVSAAKKEWEETIDRIDDMLLLVDPHGRVLRCNRAFQQFAGKPYAAIVGHPCGQILRGVGIAAELSAPGTVECFHERTGKWFLLNRYPFEGIPADDTAGEVVTIRDTTELRRISGELQGKNTRLKEALEELGQTQAKFLQQENMASIGQLAAGVTQEISNPVGFIQSNLVALGKYLERLTGFLAAQSECIAAGAPAPMTEAVRQKRAQLRLDYMLKDIDDLIRESLEGMDRVRSVVGDMKVFSRPDEGGFRREDINECVRRAVLLAGSTLSGRVTLRKELGKVPPTRCNPRQIDLAFLNLLVNAGDASEGHGTVTVRSWQEDGYVCVSVADMGHGIPAENLNRIFDPFFTTREAGRWTGLGLSIARDIVQRHNGSISVQSTPREGATFTVRIPIVEEA